MEKFTAKNYPIEKAPKRITLGGDKTKRPEPAQHIIEFPGGAVEVSRTTEGNYWAHIIVNHDLHRGAKGRASRGAVIDGRIDYFNGSSVCDIDNADLVSQIAILIQPEGI
jgi:hypothetical protein